MLHLHYEDMKESDYSRITGGGISHIRDSACLIICFLFNVHFFSKKVAVSGINESTDSKCPPKEKVRKMK